MLKFYRIKSVPGNVEYTEVEGSIKGVDLDAIVRVTNLQDFDNLEPAITPLLKEVDISRKVLKHD